LNYQVIISDVILTIFLVLQVYVVVDASGTFNPVVRDAALTRASDAGAVLINWFAVACELQKDWRLGPNAGQVGAYAAAFGGNYLEGCEKLRVFGLKYGPACLHICTHHC
jgi:hypothetical protein